MVEYADASCNESNVAAYVGQRICRSIGSTSVEYFCGVTVNGYNMARCDFTVAGCPDNPTHEHCHPVFKDHGECKTVVDARPAKSYQYFCRSSW
jgi:hypothetical protein